MDIVKSVSIAKDWIENCGVACPSMYCLLGCLLIDGYAFFSGYFVAAVGSEDPWPASCPCYSNVSYNGPLSWSTLHAGVQWTVEIIYW
jgi:hypothetical protein